MKHLIKPTCKHGCRFLQVTDELWLCPHAAYGQASYLRGAVKEGRQLLERAGGYEAVLGHIVATEDRKKEEKREQRKRKNERLVASVHYD
jgi:hypothetical protein